MGGFLSGLGTLLGGFNVARRIDEDGFDWREKQEAEQFARDRTQQVAGQKDEDRAIQMGTNVALGTPEGQEPDYTGLDFGSIPQNIAMQQIAGKLRGTKPYILNLEAQNRQALEDKKIGGRLALAEFGADARQALLNTKQAWESNREPSPRDLYMAEQQANRLGLSLGAMMTRLDITEAGRESRFQRGLDLRQDALDFRRESAEGGGTEQAQNTYGHLMQLFNAQPFDSPLFRTGAAARITGGVRRSLAMGGLAPETKAYLEGVKGFAPMLARGAGHQGRLSDKDLERTEQLFPMPGDSIREVELKNKLIEDILAGQAPLPFVPEGDGGEIEDPEVDDLANILRPGGL